MTSRGEIRVPGDYSERMRKTIEAHEEGHRQMRERTVRRIALLASALTDEEWEQVKEFRKSGRGS